jgi:hypothetical protein
MEGLAGYFCFSAIFDADVAIDSKAFIIRQPITTVKTTPASPISVEITAITESPLKYFV